MATFIKGGGSQLALQPVNGGYVSGSTLTNFAGTTIDVGTVSSDTSYSIDGTVSEDDVLLGVWLDDSKASDSSYTWEWDDVEEYWKLTIDEAGLTDVSCDILLLSGSKVIELPFTTESFNPIGDFINSNAISGGRSRGIGEAGNKAGDGSLDVEISEEQFPFLFFSALGDIQKWDITTDDEAIITPVTDELPAFDVFIQHGATSTDTYKFIEQKINNFRFTLSSDSILTASIDFVGHSVLEDGSGNIQTVEFPTVTDDLSTITYMFPSSLTSILIDGNQVLDYLTSIDVTIANNVSTDLHKLDASGRIAVLAGELNVSGSIELLFPTSVYDSNVYDMLDALDIGDSLNGITIGFGTDYVINLRHCYVTNVTHDIGDRGALQVTVDFDAKHNSTDTSESYYIYPINITSSLGTDTLTPFVLDADVTCSEIV